VAEELVEVNNGERSKECREGFKKKSNKLLKRANGKRRQGGRSTEERTAGWAGEGPCRDEKFDDQADVGQEAR